jgi:aminoglycoside phosphotransferase family enzyme/predicted kinase
VRTARKSRAARAAARPAFVAALLAPDCYDHAVERVRLAETHISWVFLTGDYAYKVKKPITLPFLDFGTLAKRRHFCDEELRLNQRLAPELYLAVVPIGGTPARPRVGRRPAFEYAVKMRQFPDAARLDRRLAAGEVSADAVRAFAAKLAAFYAARPPLFVIDGGAAAVDAALANFADLEPLVASAERKRLAGLRKWTAKQAESLAPLFARRAQSGAYRECHGDLHLENLLEIDGRIVAFDALEFDARLREIDVMSEAAFVAMDFHANGRPDLGCAFLNSYLEASGDYDGLALLRFYLVYRALVRAKVRAIKASQNAAESGRAALAPYLDTAMALGAERQPLLLITHGLSGSGKTHVTNELVTRLPALRVRSDLERKRLHGLGAAARTGSAVGQGLYGSAATARTYERLAQVADTALRAGFDCIVDGTFLRRAERAAFRQVAAANGARFAILDCRAPTAELRRRITQREAAGRDASEATLAVLEWQIASDDPFDASERNEAVRIDTARPIDYGALAAKIAAR